MRFLPAFCGSNSWGVTPGQERASKVQTERNVGGIPKAEHTLFRITHKIVHVGMHSYIDLTNKYPIVFPIAHPDTVSHKSGVRQWTLELCGVVSRLLHCSCTPFSGPVYTLTCFSSHCCYHLGRFPEGLEHVVFCISSGSRVDLSLTDLPQSHTFKTVTSRPLSLKERGASIPQISVGIQYPYIVCLLL